MNKNDIEDLHRPEGGSEEHNCTICCYKALDKKLNLRKVDRTKPGFQAGAVLFSENLTHYNQCLAWKCRELKRASKIHSSWSSKGIVKLRYTMNECPISIMHDSDNRSLS